MKFTNMLLYIMMIGVSSFSNGQIVNIPDANFKNALINTLCVADDATSCEGFFPVDIDGDGEIQVGEAEIVSHLCVWGQDIASLEGIQAFINLESLHVEQNNLTEIDVSQNTLLKVLYCFGNSISSIDLSSLPDLEVLQISGNNLSTLVTNNNPKLRELNCIINQITSLDLTENLDLQTLVASNNQLTQIDITQNSVLDIFDVGTNQITGSMDFSQNSDIRSITLFRNQVTSIDGFSNPSLTRLSIGENPIEGNIDVSQSPLVKIVLVNQTQISGLNIQNGNNNNFTNFSALDTPNLFCIQVDNPILVQTGVPPYDEWEKDAQAEYRSVCSLGITTIDATQIEVYPNPVGDLLFIDSKTYELQEVAIYNVEGKQLLELKNVPAQISLAHIPSGILFVKVTTNQGTITKKIIKK